MGPVSRLDRVEKLLGGLDVANTQGIEIGALASPMLRPPSAHIRFVDHADQAALRAKYAADPNVRLDDIVFVDGVWGEKTLAECFPGESFDYVIASHVIEHVPDVIGWLAEVAAVLRPDGRLILAIPDRRYTFDVLRQETRLSDLIDNRLRHATRPTPAQVFDCKANVVDFDHVKAWSPLPHPAPKHFVGPDWALAEATRSRDGAYLDCHCSVFTARSILGLLDGLLELGMLPFRLDRFHVAEVGSAEMSLVLLRQPDGADNSTARLAIATMLRAGVDSEGLAIDTPPAKEIPDVVDDPRIAELEGALLAIQASRFWKLTAPARAAIIKLRRARSVLTSRVR